MSITNLIPIIGLAFLLFISAMIFTIARGQSKRKASTKTTKRSFAKGALDTDNAEDYLSKHDKRNTARKMFSAVSIAHDMNNCCVAVQSLGNVRFLNKEAPLVPLKNCSQKDQCECRYIHHADRRTGQRRNTYTSIAEDALDVDRRNAVGKRGRRFTDR